MAENITTPEASSKPPAKARGLESLLDLARPRLLKLVQSDEFADRLMAVTLNCVARTPLLRQCTPESIVRSVVQLAEMGLEPGGSLGDGYLVPYRNKDGEYIAQPIPGYRGLVRLALEEGLAVRVDAVIIRQGDGVAYDDSTLPPRLIHRPIPLSDAPMIGVYCVISIATKVGDTMVQTQRVEVMTKKQTDAIKNRSKSKTGPWLTDEEEMAKKTVFKRGSKWIGIRPSTKFGRALEADDEDVIEAEATRSEERQERAERKSAAVTSFDDAARKIADAASAPRASAPMGEIPPAPDEEEIPPPAPKVSDAGVDTRVQQAMAEMRGAGLATGDGPNPGGPKNPPKGKKGAKAAKEAIDRALFEEPATPPAKCDGGHAAPPCADPQCWHKDDPTAEPPEPEGDSL